MQCCHGDGSGETCAYEYHGHSLYYQATVNCLRLFKKFVAMATVVMGDTCVQSITAIRTIIRLLG